MGVVVVVDDPLLLVTPSLHFHHHYHHHHQFTRSWVKGVLGSTVSNVVSHPFSRKRFDDEGVVDGDEEEDDILFIPGRAYYIKPRKLHGGATMKEVNE